MAIDGSFSLESELRRFLDRCPELKSVRCFDYFSKKGISVTVEEVVHAVGELLLHPDYTIPLLGCFRPIAQKIVERTVRLLHLSTNLRSDDDHCMEEEEFNENEFLREAVNVDNAEVPSIIDVYATRGKGLRLHELACLAFCRALDLMPFLLGSILKYFEVAPAPFERIIQCYLLSKPLFISGGANQLLNIVGATYSQLLNVVRVSYRLLILEPEVFTKLWDWSCFLDLVQQSTNLALINDAEQQKIISDIRWCIGRILSVALRLSSKASAKLGLVPEEDLQSFLRWQEFCMDVSLEKWGWYVSPSVEETEVTVGKTANLKEGHSLKRCRFGSFSVPSTPYNIMSLNQVNKLESRGLENPFVMTSAARKSFEMISLAVSQRWPVLLYGPAGAGKTALINNVAHIHRRRVLSIQMDEQIDGKTLTGSYVCTEHPGEFRWQPGSLTQAVLHGFWVVFEDVDKAPPDVLAILLPLLEGTATFSTGHGEAVRVNEEFRLFATATNTNQDISPFTEGRGSLGAFWRRIMITPPSNEDLLNIVLQWYPELGFIAEQLIETLGSVNRLTRSQFGLAASSGYHVRFTLRDLLKLCKRISSYGFRFCDGGLSANERRSIYEEAVDVFASFYGSVSNRLAIMREIAKLWSIPAAETLYPVNKPIIQDSGSAFEIGRVRLERAETTPIHDKPFVELRCSVHALERIACSVKFNEPVLLVGETGTGKTTLVQTLARRLGQKLTVLNLSQQSDVADLLGGFKPEDARSVCIPLYYEFRHLFTETFPSKGNEILLAHFDKVFTDKNWTRLLKAIRKAVGQMAERIKPSPGMKRKKLNEELLTSWENFCVKLERAFAQVNESDGMVFSFVEGAFINALKNGEWILLDEVNLAPPEVLQRIVGVLEDEKGSLCLAERGDIDYVRRHSNFHIFACMNPATDASKRDLPFSLRSRFTEYFVDDMLDDEDLVLFIRKFVDEPSGLIGKILQFYKAAKESEERLQDGANLRPHYSLRSLYRALEYFKMARGRCGFEKSLYDAFGMFFLNLLDESSAKWMNNLICKYLLEGKAPPQDPRDPFLISEDGNIFGSYILTESVKKHLGNLTRATFIGKYPILLQGPTSSGKTSLVRFLAERTGHEFTRINNHEHTDLQEYLGSYITDASGKLVFQEGALVKAVRKGHWIVLDELNLAPSDVLEALNRLLDDNRELFVPELGETIRAHPDFMLFATQNPPLVYGGRKMLSRAFRNRFVEMHVDEIPHEELSIILEKRCKIPGSYARKMVAIMEELQLHRQGSKIFAGKHGFMTPRDLFRWADRFRKYGKSYEDLACDGYYLMAERLRDDTEKRIVRDVLERQLRIQLSEDDLYNIKSATGGDGAFSAYKFSEDNGSIGKIIWTKSMWRMYFLVERCYKMREPVLLVGETGGGKTTVCQMLSIMLGSKLHVLNCHQYTETSDFLGGFYPVRERSRIAMDFQNLCNRVKDSKVFKHFPGDKDICSDIGQASRILHMFTVVIKSYREHSVSHPEISDEELEYVESLCRDLCQLQQKWRIIFEWQDGPLVEAMKSGDLFLVDEISLADDSVLERLNSVLEPERKLSLAEKGGSNLENIIAHPDFFLLATMNPGGDYGKKELSPALRNRFVEIWVPSVSDKVEIKSIALQRILNPKNSDLVDIMVNFWEWFDHLQTGRILSVRDLLSWVSFINVMDKQLPAESALIHGAFLVLLDGLSLGTNISKSDAAELRVDCFSFILKKIEERKQDFNSSCHDRLETYGWGDSQGLSVPCSADNMVCDNRFGIDPFYIEKGTEHLVADGFEFLAPTTRRNTLRVLRAMQLNKPVLLEGSPGVGKTSLVVALGRFSGHSVVRINLSEQTDIMDLLGSDLPVESDEGIKFAWSDGILLQALKKGSWVLLDELNLAPQSVLEGLNAILDHRGEVFIPELGRSFKCPMTFRVFACQNPSYQGGGRKGLPKSFLNRFTKVYVDELDDEDYLSICSSLFPSIERILLENLVEFNKRLHLETMLYHKFGHAGSPWEFNLRDIIRSCQIIQDASKESRSYCFLSTIYLQRMRTADDRIEMLKLYEQIFGVKPSINPYPRVQLNPHSLIIGEISVERNQYQPSGISKNDLKILPDLRHCLEAVVQCVKHQWLCVLVGPPSSGKTSLIRLVASLTGNVLKELNLSSASDISELIGCFEQYNASRHYHLAIAQVERYVNEYCSIQLESFPNPFIEKKDLESFPEAFIQQKDLSKRWFTFLSTINYPSTPSATYLDCPSMRTSIPLLVEIIQLLKGYDKTQMLPVSWSQKDLDNTLHKVKKLEEDHQKRQYSAKFEWVSGVLVKAIENGEWIVLENANLCNPTVLDRINSLVEQSGSITINECGIVGGKPMVLLPHPKFRMFLTVNPSHGEVSRAMRNRGVEIYLMPPHWLVDEICGEILDEIELRDVKRFIALSGIPVHKLVDMMAKAHIYVKQRASHLNVTITYLELSRWLQLFQQLITSGNQPAWSIQISWEHTYISSLGEGKGKDIVSQAAVAYLSMPELYTFSSFEDCLSCLPGGWPNPLKLMDYIYYPKEACVRQNCMYLESLGSNVALRTFGSSLGRCPNGQNLLAGGLRTVHHMGSVSLDRLVFPKASNDMLGNHDAPSDLEMVLAQKKLLSAADWVIEQATESDYCLYIRWFEWFDSQIQPSFSFFKWFSDLLKEELEHSIWRRMVSLRHELMSRPSFDQEPTSLPLLSTEWIDVCPVGGLDSGRILMNSIKCIGILRRSLRQWSTEKRYIHSSKAEFLPVLASLRTLEEKLLDLLVEFPDFDVRLKAYIDLLEHHIHFWNSIVSSQIERQQISSRSLLRDAAKVKDICPAEVEIFQIKMKHLDVFSSLCLGSQVSLLWRNGGHPILPSSAELFQKHCQFTELCNKVWPRRNTSTEPDVNEITEIKIEPALSANVELRLLAMQGVCLLSYVIGKADDDDSEIIQQLEEMYQMLLRKLDFEKNQLEMKVGTSTVSSCPELDSACCVYTPGVICRSSAFEFWLKSQPVADETSLFLDFELLRDLTRVTVTDIEQYHHELRNLSGRLQSALNFSLNYSSRLPTDFVPHQKILWTIDAWSTVDRASEKVSCFILEMWFRLHAALWEACPENVLSDDGYDVLLPHKLLRTLRLTMVDQFLQSTNSVRDYPLHGVKLRAASRGIWYCSAGMINLHDMLLHTAQYLFQQIIYAHKRSFEDSTYVRIVSAFSCIKELRNPQESMKDLVSLLASSNHHIFTTIIGSYIEPLLKELYPVGSSDDLWLNIGCAFLRIGGLRYSLLVCCDDLDPAVKYSIKYSELTDKIASMETDIKVRNECAYLAGSVHLREADGYRINLLEELKAERSRQQRKMVFRPNPGNFKELKRVCCEFLELVTTFFDWIKNIESMQIEHVTVRVRSWQESMSCFIDRLSNEYSAYADIIQPVLVAIYEMKLGFSLIVSSVLYKKYGNLNMEMAMRTIYTFMRFPRGCSSKTVLVHVVKQPKLSARNIELPLCVEEVDINLLQDMIDLIGKNVSDGLSSTLPLKVAVYHNLLVRVKESVSNARFFSDSSFKLLHGIYDDVVRLWIKHRATSTEKSEAQPFKFRARAFKLENIIKYDVSNCANLLANDSFSEWQELLCEELDEKMKANEALEHDWEAEEPILDDIVNIHNQLFGSVDLAQRLGTFEVSEKDRVASFLGSYTVGVKMARDLKGSVSFSFDAKLAPEHLFRLCLEHKHKFILPQRSTGAYNFYKHPNASVMAQLVKPLELLRQQFLLLLKEPDDHPAMEKIFEVIDMILARPLDTPLWEALLGLEFLLNRIRIAQDTVSKFPLSGDQVQPIFALVSSLYKLEVESWLPLLDEVLSQFERNAGKLWFPLYSIFQRNHTADLERFSDSTIQSLEEFFNTSSVGEFKKQLQLLLSLCGQINSDLSRRSYESTWQGENVKILYNTFGFYVQLLPRIMEHMGTIRRSVEMELEELVKLCRFDRIDNHVAIENLKRSRAKLRKIVKKYTDLLGQPLVEFLVQDASRSGIKTNSFQGAKPMIEPFQVSRTLLDTVCNYIQSKHSNSSMWFVDWWKALDCLGELMGSIQDCIPSQSSCLMYWEERNQWWHTIERICNSLIHSGELWEDRSKKLGKRRAFSDLLKILDSCGLSKHRSFAEGEFDTSQTWLLQPAYEVQHLLPTQGDLFSANVDAGFGHPQSSSNEVIWGTANKYYFKSIASIKFLEKICLNFHKDFTLVQVKRSGSYVDHLIEIQQGQRAVAYNVAKQLKFLRECMWPLSNLFSPIDLAGETRSASSFIKNQHAIFNCMWQQKQLLDGFCSMLYEEHLLLQTIENNHLDTCSSVKQGVEKIRQFIENALPDFQKSKDLLDNHLLGSTVDITMAGNVLHPYGVTKEMEQLVNQNFELIRTFEKNVSVFNGQEDEKGIVKFILLDHFNELFSKGAEAEKLYHSLPAKRFSHTADGNPDRGEEAINILKSGFDGALKGTYERVLGIFRRIGSLKYDSALTEESLKIKDWKVLFERDVEQLELDFICKDVMRTIQSAGELLNYCGDENPSVGSWVCLQLRDLYAILLKILAFGENLLQDFLILHNMVSAVSYVLATMLASLFAQGFGTAEDEENESVKEITKDANGTGMGEGAGLNDVSDQINDEDQLLGTSEKQNEEGDNMPRPNPNDKGIEMEHDLSGEAYSASENSEDDESENNQDEQLESTMGEVGANNEIVNEILGDMEDDENGGTNEKYEHGPAVKDKASLDEELRSVEDSTAAIEDASNPDAEESKEQHDETGNEENSDGAEDMNVDRADTFQDPSGIIPEEQNQMLDEDAQMDEGEATEQFEDGESEDNSVSDSMKDEENTDLMDEFREDENSKPSTDTNAEGSFPENKTEADSYPPERDVLEFTPNLAQPAGQPNEISDAAYVEDFAGDEINSNFDECNDFASTSDLPNASQREVGAADSRTGERFRQELPRTSLPSSESLIPKAQPNPCRSVGDALDGWKERVKISVDLQDQLTDTNDMVDENADEYGYTGEFKEGTAQALGPATADQIMEDVTQNEIDREMGNTGKKDPIAESEIEKQTSESGPIRTVNDAQKQQNLPNLEKQPKESLEVDGDFDQYLTSLSESLVSVRRSYINEDTFQLNKCSISDNELGKSNVFEPSADARNDAAALWRRYELNTARLSQELAEQLRLVMEPTLASKLQGDYKTGKRINMKKVIPYVASHFRKDKIWLRRTRPSKRDYQVVIAIDDSRSMSEGHCGNFAIEALVTVCRAMSQLEVGNLAVASFGRQGNIRLLHDFDQPFTPEAGVNMISSLTFKQENTIADEPMVDLLKYVNNMLDAAVMHARLPSGYNPLQQLVLIIADGRFNEKEKLKRRVRDILSKRRMVAFLLLDSPDESIVDFMEATVQGKNIKFSKYLDSFPFPYYVVLKNIEALPKTLADLLRQWFELMQYARE